MRVARYFDAGPSARTGLVVLIQEESTFAAAGAAHGPG